ncbi:MAG: thymidine phosphorylase [Vicinamibacterales bacterium]
MRAVDIIRAKRDGEALEPAAIAAFVAGVLDGSWADYQTAAFLMAVVWRGMTPRETAALTEAMLLSGRRVDLSGIPGPKVGKHSTGGVGDKVSLVLAPLVAACGVVMPKMSGRGLGHTGGTLDKLEAIPGFRVGLDVEDFVRVLGDVGCAIIGQTADVAPADRALYALRDVTATVESVPLITASIMSKKLAEGSGALVLDVKCGRGAFMKTLPEAVALAGSLVETGRAHGVPTEALITAMERPLGRAVGNALEVRECLDALDGRGPADLWTVVRAIGVRVLRLAGRAASDAEAGEALDGALASGAARRKLRDMVAAQGGAVGVIDDPSGLPQAPLVETVGAPAAGVVADIDALAIGRAAAVLGAGRRRAGDTVDHAAGVRLLVAAGDAVQPGDGLLELHGRERERMDEARRAVAGALTFGPASAAAPLILAWVTSDGDVRQP